MFGTMSTADAWQIKNGNDFIVGLALTASNANRPTEWYQVKPGANELTKENILDTLRPNEFGEISFKTRKYHVGTNQIKFITRVRLPQGDRQIARTVTFLVLANKIINILILHAWFIDIFCIGPFFFKVCIEC